MVFGLNPQRFAPTISIACGDFSLIGLIFYLRSSSLLVDNAIDMVLVDAILISTNGFGPTLPQGRGNKERFKVKAP